MFVEDGVVGDTVIGPVAVPFDVSSAEPFPAPFLFW
jgi:hypothetical protein